MTVFEHNSKTPSGKKTYFLRCTICTICLLTYFLRCTSFREDKLFIYNYISRDEKNCINKAETPFVRENNFV